jgi:hypothetical protein
LFFRRFGLSSKKPFLCFSRIDFWNLLKFVFHQPNHIAAGAALSYKLAARHTIRFWWRLLIGSLN